MTPSAAAEAAIFAANQLSSIARKPRRRLWGSWRRVERSEDRLRLELAIPRATAAAEDYMLIRATAELHPILLESVPPPHPPDDPTKLLQEAARRFPKLLKVWRDELRVDLEGLDDWTEFNLWRELRHVLVHRLGNWQPGLDPKPLLRDRIDRIGADPDRYRGEVPLVDDDLTSAIANAIALISSADAKVIT